MLVTLATTTLLFTAAVGRAPSQFLGGDDVVLLGPTEGLPGRSTMDVELVAPLESIPGVVAASPEIYVLTTLEGRSMFVRGVEFEPFLAVEEGRLIEGRLPTAQNEALAGRHFLRVFGRVVGDEVPIASSFLRIAVPVTIVGVLETRSAASDELMLPLPLARDLGDVPEGRIHMIRARSTDVQGLDSLFESTVPVFTYSNVTISSTKVLTGEAVTMRASLTNWGRFQGTKNVEVRMDGSIVASGKVTLSARSTTGVTLRFLVDSPGHHNISVNPTFDLEARDPTLFLNVPARVYAGESLQVRVVDGEGTPVPGVTVVGDGLLAYTNGTGVAILRPPAPGSLTLGAIVDDERRGHITFDVVERGPQGALVRLRSWSLPPGPIGTNETIRVAVSFENVGDAASDVALRFLLDDAEQWSDRIHLPPGAQQDIPFDVGPLVQGTHKLAFDEYGGVEVRVYEGGSPEVQEFLERPEGGSQSELETGPPISFSVTESADEYVARVIGDIRGVVLALSFLSACLTTIGLVFVLVRHLAEAEPKLGIYRALGATNAHVSAIVEREVALRMAAGAAIGAAAGVLVARAIASASVVRAFGHSIAITTPPTLLALLFVLSVGVAVLTAKAILAYSLRTPLDQLLRGSALRPLPVRAPLLDEVLAPP